jgi:hypothetical protein
MSDAGDGGVEEDLELAERELRAGLSRRGDDGVAEGAVLAHHGVEAEAEPQSLDTVPGRGRAVLGRGANR